MWKIKDLTELNAIRMQSYQMEFDWLAIDKIGQIAIFSNFNSGYVPQKVTSSLELFNEIAELIEKLKEITEAKLVKKENGKYDDWITYSKKGLFVYDDENIHSINKQNRYELISKPEKPLKATLLFPIDKYDSVIPHFDLEFSEYLTFEKLQLSLKY